MSDILEFGFEDSEVVKTNELEMFKQSANAKKHVVSIISFKKHSDKVLRKKEKEAEEAGVPLTDSDRAAILAKVDVALAERLKKKVEDLTEVDRLDINDPRFGVANTHYSEGVGGFRCLSTFSGQNITKRAVCCEKYGDPAQQVATIIMTYPVNQKDGTVDKELLKMQKYVNFYAWRMTSKKFTQINQTYTDARNDDKRCINMRVELDGDPQYQKQKITVVGSATWATEGMEEVRNWVLDQGIRMFAQIDKTTILGMKMTEDKLRTKMAAAGQAAQITGGEEEKPKLAASSSYDDLIT